MMAVQKDGNAIKYVTDNLKDNKHFVLNAIQQSLFAFRHASPRMKNDIDIVLAMVRKDPHYALRFVPTPFTDNKKIMIEAVRRKGFFLEHASRRLQNDFEIVLAAVRSEGGSINYASPALKNDVSIVMAAVRNQGHALKYASKTLQNNIEVVVNAELQKLGLPSTDILMNMQDQAVSLFPYILEQAKNCPIVIYYLLKNRHDMI